MPREGWAKRAAEESAYNVYEWPEWMRREGGLLKPQSNAISDALKLLDEAAWFLGDGTHGKKDWQDAYKHYLEKLHPRTSEKYLRRLRLMGNAKEKEIHTKTTRT